MPDTVVLMFVFAIAVANLVLGYATAAHFGYGPRDWQSVNIALGWQRAPSSKAGPAPAESRAEVVDEVPPDSKKFKSVRVPQPYDGPADDGLGLANPLETAHYRICYDLKRLCSRAACVEFGLRQPAPAADNLASLADELRSAVTRSLARLKESCETMRTEVESEKQRAESARQVQLTVDRFAQSAAAILDELNDSLECDPATEARVETLRNAATQIHQAVYVCGQALDEPLLETMAGGGDWKTISPGLLVDEQYEMANRAGFEFALAGVDESAASTAAGRTVVLLDIDALGRLNRQLGPAAGEQIFMSVRDVVRQFSAADGAREVAIVAGNQFAVVFHDATVDEAGTTAERIRQAIENTVFLAGAETVAVTVSAAVATVGDGEPGAECLGLLRSMLREVKNYGRNRTFLYDQKGSVPVVPPELVVEPRTVLL